MTPQSAFEARVGDVVHFHANSGTVAAIVTSVVDPARGDVTLTVFYPPLAHMDPEFRPVPFSVEPKPGHWSWRPAAKIRRHEPEPGPRQLGYPSCNFCGYELHPNETIASGWQHMPPHWFEFEFDR